MFRMKWESGLEKYLGRVSTTKSINSCFVYRLDLFNSFPSWWSTERENDEILSFEVTNHSYFPSTNGIISSVTDLINNVTSSISSNSNSNNNNNSNSNNNNNSNNQTLTKSNSGGYSKSFVKRQFRSVALFLEEDLPRLPKRDTELHYISYGKDIFLSLHEIYHLS